MACKSCGGNRGEINPGRVIEPVQQQVNSMSDSDFILVSYNHPNLGQHKVVGYQTKTNYGYRGGGGVEQFYVHKDDIAVQPDLFKPVDRIQDLVIPTEIPAAPMPIAETKSTPVSVPVKVDAKEMDLQLVPGVSDSVMRELNMSGIYNVADLKGLTEDQLVLIKGIGKNRASQIVEFVKSVD